MIVLPGAGVVRQQEPHARKLEQIVVYRLELMRQRVDARDRETEIRVKLVGDAEGIGLKSQPKQSPVAIEGMLRVENSETFEILVVIVTFRNRSEFVPTRPTAQLAGPLDWTVSTRIGSLKRDPSGSGRGS